jgi:hypothetical protein
MLSHNKVHTNKNKLKIQQTPKSKLMEAMMYFKVVYETLTLSVATSWYSLSTFEI